MTRAIKLTKLIVLIVSILLLVSIACQISNPFIKSTPEIEETQPPSKPEETETYPPAIVEVQPPDNSVLSTDDSITFYFNQSMNTDTVEAGFNIQPDISGTFSWQDTDTLTFIPDDNLEPETELTFSLSESSLGENGLALPEESTFRYKTAGYFKLTETLPKPGSEDNNPSSAIVASFNLPIVPMQAEPSQQPAAFSLLPNAEGHGEWINSSTYIFYPDPPLSGGSQYTVTLDEKLTSTQGTTIDPAPESLKEWTFRTAMPALLSVEPDPNLPLLLDDPLVMHFNQTMDQDSVEEAFALLDPRGNSLPGKFTWNDSFSEATFTPDERLKRYTTYVLSLSGSAAGLGGTAIGEDITHSFLTVPNLEIASTSPPAGESMKVYFGFASLTLNFNTPISVDNIKDYISVSPAVDSLNATLSTDKTSVFLSGYFQQNLSYAITISGDIKDKWGDPPRKALTVIMKTAAAEPAISVPLFMSGIQEVFFTSNDTVLPIQAANISGLEVISSEVSLSEFINLQQMNYEEKSEYVPANAASQYINLGLKNKPYTNIEIPLSESDTPLSPGLYYFHLKASEISRKTYQTSPIILGVVSDINMTIKRNVDQLVVWLVDIDTNTPIPNREVVIYDQWAVEVNRGLTDENGLCTIDVPKAQDTFPLYYLMTGTPGQSDFGFGIPTWSSGIAGWSFNINTELIPYEPYTYLYTDRPIYRPGQTVNFRGVIRNEDNGRYASSDIKTVTVNILGEYDMATSSREDIETQVLEVSKYGTFTGSVTLPENANPGYYRIEVEDLPYASS